MCITIITFVLENCKTCCLSEQLNLHCERCKLDLLYFSTRRCFLWRSVYWNGWSSFPDGKRPAGNLNHHEHKLLQSFIALQLHHEVKVANYRVNYFFLFLSFPPPFSFQAALSIFGMISGPLLGLYLLGMFFRTSNSIVSISLPSDFY